MVIYLRRSRYFNPGSRPARGSELRRGTGGPLGRCLVSPSYMETRPPDSRTHTNQTAVHIRDSVGSSCISQLQQHFRCLRFSSLLSMASESLCLILFNESADTFSVALWDKGMFGLNYPDQVDAAKTNWNNNLPVNPLRESDGFSINQWFGHGYKGFPPKSGDFMVLPSGGKYSGDVHCNRYGSRTRNPNITTPLPQYACDVSQDWKTHPLIYRL